MQSLNSESNGRVVTRTVWLLFAVALNALEFFIPRVPFFPWLKPGFANIITIIWIIEFGAIDAILYSLLRVWITGFFFGFSFVTMALALSGGVLSAAAMSVLWVLLGKKGILGTVGLGVCGAVCHNIGQLAAVYLLMAANTHLFFQVPVMLVASAVFGGLIGMLAPLFREALVLRETAARPSSAADGVAKGIASASTSDYFFSLLLLAGCFALAFTDSIPALLASSCGAALIVQARNKKPSLKELVAPLTSFWMLFAFIAFINLFFSYGTRIERVPIITHEGAGLTIRQWLRLWTWIEVSFIFSYFNFNIVMLSMLKKLFPHHKATLFSGVLALEFLPAVAADGRVYMKNVLALFFAAPVKTLNGIFSFRQGNPFSRLVRELTDVLYGIITARMEKASG
jgi:heptaprenyl diphosphate synthase